MQLKSLTVAAFILGLGVVAGCDDPEVQDKVLSVLEHGSASAELKCYVDGANPVLSGQPSLARFEYTANKLIDGSCFVSLCLMQGTALTTSGIGDGAKCQTSLLPRSTSGSEVCHGYLAYDVRDTNVTYPFRLGVDGFNADVEDGYLNIVIKDNFFNNGSANCTGSSGTCVDPFPWFSQDITDTGNCTGRNLELFGASP